MKATIPVDHRVSDGAVIVTFKVSRAAEGASAPETIVTMSHASGKIH